MKQNNISAARIRAQTMVTTYTRHVTFFFDKGSYIIDRHKRLVREMRHRNINVNYDTLKWPRHYSDFLELGICAKGRQDARPLLIERISERLIQMKRRPTWTNQNAPEWAQESLLQRKAKQNA